MTDTATIIMKHRRQAALDQAIKRILPRATRDWLWSCRQNNGDNWFTLVLTMSGVCELIRAEFRKIMEAA